MRRNYNKDYDRDYDRDDNRRFGRRSESNYGRRGDSGYSGGYPDDFDSDTGDSGYFGGSRRYGEGYAGGGGGYGGFSGSSSERGYSGGSDYDRNYGYESNFDRGSDDYNRGGSDYDRDYDYNNRSSYRSSGNSGQDYNRDYDRSSGSLGSARSDYGGGRSSNRGDRGWFDKASDEVSSWFGDDNAEQRRQRDRQSHRGKGPKNYTRSDDRIKENVNERLSDSHYLDASNIEVSVDDGEVTLSGTVNSRYDKRRAEDLADNVSGVNHTQNNLRVSQSSSSSYQTSTDTNTSQTASSTSSSGKTGDNKSKSASS